MRKGFTIAELLIVVVVISILAIISIATYNGVKSRANDSLRKSDMRILAQAIKRYDIEKGDLLNQPGDGGYSGAGWVSKGAYGGNSIIDCLQRAKVEVPNLVDPSGCPHDQGGCAVNSNFHAYLKINCVSESGVPYSYVMARLDTESMATPNDLSASRCQYANWVSRYMVNYFVRVG